MKIAGVNPLIADERPDLETLWQPLPRSWKNDADYDLIDKKK